jgi:hybrid cluster-associated redox disulfide protein
MVRSAATPRVSNHEALGRAVMCAHVPQVCARTKSGRAIRVSVQWGTEARMPIRFDDLVDDVMRRSPETIRVFLQFRMRCVGCPIACFHTVDDACREHGVDREAFFRALAACT